MLTHLAGKQGSDEKGSLVHPVPVSDVSTLGQALLAAPHQGLPCDACRTVLRFLCLSPHQGRTPRRFFYRDLSDIGEVPSQLDVLQIHGALDPNTLVSLITDAPGEQILAK